MFKSKIDEVLPLASKKTKHYWKSDLDINLFISR
ncbi:MAG: hypothetical protein JWP12_2403 [Bacteroidetes bacterium]|nr:hypothetical protein [Bacteroidota bacterium]